ncbi:uncharacterized protein LOC128238805 isoform X1 [Mya arenaria]|uniref:uncharacterized protein LOC128238805 isoform X1 n=2 Tax=Mya arenaria TaxID=6604 RepID=UPI0022DEA89E|nr:uncharacterized protein LOC128238805 isoform X1 [Mya arenaria]
MTYDKVHYTMNRHHNMDGDFSGAETGTPFLAGEKCSLKKPRGRRKKGTKEINLRNIAEGLESTGNVDTVMTVVNGGSEDDSGCSSVSRDQRSSTDTDNFQAKELNNIERISINNVKPKTHRNLVANEIRVEKESEEVLNEFRVKINTKNQTVPNLHLRDRDEYGSDHVTCNEIRRQSNRLSSSEKDVKLQAVRKCAHMLHKNGPGRDIDLQKKFKNFKNDEVCIICEITEATANYASVEANRMLMEIVYPHDFYDKFQRSGKAKGQSSVQKTNSVTKDSINFCRPAKLSPKLGRRGRTMLLPATDRPEPSVNTSAKDNHRTWASTERLSTDACVPEKRWRSDAYTEKKNIHTQCRERPNAVVVTDDTDGQKLVLKGLRGWLMKKEEAPRTSRDFKDIKKSAFYKVSSLGIQFGIPEYNTTLHERKLTTPPTSARLNDTQQSIKRPATQINSERHQPSANQILSRDIHSVPTHTRAVNSGTYPRSIMHVSKLFADTAMSDVSTSESKSVRNTTNDSQNLQSSLQIQKTKFSLPPINHDLKTRSVTLTQF